MNQLDTLANNSHTQLKYTHDSGHIRTHRHRPVCRRTSVRTHTSPPTGRQADRQTGRQADRQRQRQQRHRRSRGSCRCRCACSDRSSRRGCKAHAKAAVPAYASHTPSLPNPHRPVIAQDPDHPAAPRTVPLCQYPDSTPCQHPMQHPDSTPCSTPCSTWTVPHAAPGQYPMPPTPVRAHTHASAARAGAGPRGLHGGQWRTGQGRTLHSTRG